MTKEEATVFAREVVQQVADLANDPELDEPPCLLSVMSDELEAIIVRLLLEEGWL